MRKKYAAFVESLRRSIMTVADLREDQVYFVKAEENPADSGDCLFLECGVQGDLKEVCALHVDDLYEHYQRGISLEKIIGDAIEQFEAVRNEENISKVLSLADFGKIKNDLFVRLLNAERNREALKDVVHRVVGDIAMVLYLRLNETEAGFASLKIPENFFAKWGMTREAIFEHALLNTYYMNPPRVYQWQKMLYDSDYSGENFMDLMSGFRFQNNPSGDCLSTTRRTNGAVAVFLPGVAERIAQLIGHGFYMVFTSIHEVMIHNDELVEVNQLRQVLKETIEEATPEEDFLSYYIYHYNKETGEITYY